MMRAIFTFDGLLPGFIGRRPRGGPPPGGGNFVIDASGNRVTDAAGNPVVWS